MEKGLGLIRSAHEFVFFLLLALWPLSGLGFPPISEGCGTGKMWTSEPWSNDSPASVCLKKDGFLGMCGNVPQPAHLLGLGLVFPTPIPAGRCPLQRSGTCLAVGTTHHRVIRNIQAGLAINTVMIAHEPPDSRKGVLASDSRSRQ